MEPSESKPNTKEVVEGKPVKEIVERAVSLDTKVSVKSAVEQLETHGLEAAPVSHRSRGNVTWQNLEGPDDPRRERAWA